jgi:branched chain amino acid efflux pump
MNFWLLIIIIGLLTLTERLFFILLIGKREMPTWARKALLYVPVTALTALAIPAIILTDNSIDISINPKILAGIVAILVAWRTKAILSTIVAGMATFWIMTALSVA